VNSRRGYASEASIACYVLECQNCDADLYTEEKDVVIIGGDVAGYVAAIKAGQAGLKVRFPPFSSENFGY
jgi:hypothetical protein